MIVLRRQPPVYSPLPASAPWRAAGSGLGLGPDPRPRLVRRLRDHYGRENVVLFGSGTAALTVALLAARALSGGSRLTALPAFTCWDVAAAAAAADADIALYDVNPATLAPDLASLARVLEAGARVVVVSPLYGIPVDWDSVEACVGGYGAVTVEDAAQGHGASWRGRPLGGLGVLSMLSFQRGKGWTGVKGGALLFDDRAIDHVASAWSGLGDGLAREVGVVLAALAQAVLGRPALYRLPASLPWLGLGETSYRDAPPVSTMTRAAAALLESTWESSLCEADRRRANAAELLARLSPCADVRTIELPCGGTAGYVRLPLRLKGGLAGFPDPMAASALGVAPTYPSVLAAIPQVQARLVGPERAWPGAETLARELVTLPTHSLLGARDREALGRLLEYYASRRGTDDRTL